MQKEAEKIWHKTFVVSIALKALNGLLEILAGLLLVFVRPAKINSLIDSLAQSQVFEESYDFIARLLESGGHLSQGTWLFSILFLLSHGVIKIFLVFCLWKKKLWSYPLAIAVFGGFGVYQLYRFSLTHSLGMIILTVLDAAVILLTWHEYRFLRSRESAE